MALDMLTLSEHGWLDIDVIETADGTVYLGHCMGLDDERCFTFAPAASTDSVERVWREHAAEALGFCWSCGKPDDQSNREQCRRCWFIYWAEQGVLPRDAPPWPGNDQQETP